MKLGILGCGSMATGIVTGLLRSPQTEGRIASIAAGVRSRTSAQTLRHTFHDHVKTDFLRIMVDDNVRVAATSDLVLLGHHPNQLRAVLGEKGLAEALKGKGIIIILAGVPTKQIRNVLSNGEFDITRTLPNIGARLGECMTVISDPHAVSPGLVDDTRWLFGKIGRVTEVEESAYDVGAVMAGSCYSLPTIAIEGTIDGVIQQGLPRSTALEIIVQCLKGLTKMLESGDQPSTIRENIMTPGGATITGCVQLERKAVRSAFADAIIAVTERTKSLTEK